MLRKRQTESVSKVNVLTVVIRQALPIAFLLPIAFAMCSTFSNAEALPWQNIASPLFHRPFDPSSPIQGPIVSATEDKNGFMWFVTANGLWRWDSHFARKAEFAIKDDVSAAPQPIIQRLIKDDRNRIWVGTSQGLYQLDTAELLIKPVTDTKPLNDVSIQRGIYVALEDTELLIFASDRQLYQYDIISNSVTEITLPSAMRIYALHISNDNTLWLGAEKGLYSRSIAHNTPLQQTQSFPANTRITSILSLASGALVIGTAKSGVFLTGGKNNNKNSNRNNNAEFNAIPIEGDAKSAWVYGLLELNHNELLIGTFGQGLLTFNLNTNTQRLYKANKLHPSGLPDNNIWNIYRDSRDLVWIGAGESLSIFDNSNVGITHMLGGVGVAGHLPEPKVHSLVTQGDNLVVANGHQGLIEISPTKGITSTWWTASRDPIETLYSGSDGALYASSNFATVTLSKDSKAITPLSIHGRTSNTFTSAFAQSEHAMWLGGTDGLWTYPLTSPNQTQHVRLEELKDRRISALYVQKNRLWIGTWQGLYIATLDNSGLISDVVAASNVTLQQQFITDIHIDTLGQVWIGTSNAGVFVGNGENSAWKPRNTTHNLPSNTVAGIAGQSGDKIWISTSRGIVAADVNRLRIQQIVTGRQSINSPFSRGAATITKDGSIAFGGKNGVTLISPDILPNSKPPVALSFTDVFATTQNDEKIQKANSGDLMNIASLPKRIAFEFVALDYLSPEDIYYRYRVLGQDDNWTVLDANHRSITLTQPSPGHYELQVEYSFDGKKWQPNMLIQRFFVHPSWYQTSLVKFVGILALILSAYIIHQVSLRHHRSRQRKLEESVALRTAELTAANQQLKEQANALERASLTDALTGANNRRFLLQNIATDIAYISELYRRHESHEPLGSKRDEEDKSDLLFIIIDLDHFKQINDTFGHHVGDQVLIETKTRLANELDGDDYLIRWGGEEFLAVVHNQTRFEANKLAERLVTCMSASAFHINQDIKVDVSCSVGFAPYPLHMQHTDFFDWHTTVAVADAALYKSKNRGRNTWTGIVSINQAVSEQTLALIKQDPSRIFDSAETVIRPH